MPHEHIAAIRGFLAALEAAGGAPDQIPSFALEIMPAGRSLQERVSAHFGGTNYVPTLEPLDDWRRSLPVVHRWLGEFVRPERRDAVEAAFVALLAMAFPSARWAKLILEGRGGAAFDPWYEAAWDDFVIETEEEVYLLHLGVSD